MHRFKNWIEKKLLCYSLYRLFSIPVAKATENTPSFAKWIILSFLMPLIVSIFPLIIVFLSGKSVQAIEQPALVTLTIFSITFLSECCVNSFSVLNINKNELAAAYRAIICASAIAYTILLVIIWTISLLNGPCFGIIGNVIIFLITLTIGIFFFSMQRNDWESALELVQKQDKDVTKLGIHAKEKNDDGNGVMI